MRELPRFSSLEEEARFLRGLVSVQRLTKQGLLAVGPTITTLARAEGLEGHARSIDVRMADAGPAPADRRGRRAARKVSTR